MTSKRLPSATGKDSGGAAPANKSIGGRHWSFVESVGNKSEIRKHLDSTTYETKTRGTRHVEAARACGIARYKIIRNGGDVHTSLIYELEEPSTPGSAQSQFNIESSGSISILVKNPSKDFGNRPGLPRKDKPALPKQLQDLFIGKLTDQLSYIPLDPPSFLNIQGIECIWMVSNIMI